MPEAADDPWAPFRALEGSWVGESTGQPGNGRGERSFEVTLQGRFLVSRNRVSYDPQPGNPKGEVHEDLSVFSRDAARKTFLLREFHGEGFVNTYALREADGRRFVFVTEAIENIPAGWRARATFELTAPGAFTETFDLAPPGKDFESYSVTRWKRA
jgi:hypothetical protein